MGRAAIVHAISGRTGASIAVVIGLCARRGWRLLHVGQGGGWPLVVWMVGVKMESESSNLVALCSLFDTSIPCTAIPDSGISAVAFNCSSITEQVTRSSGSSASGLPYECELQLQVTVEAEAIQSLLGAVHPLS